jgi:hypothetical protein
VSPRRAAIAVATYVAAIVVALAVPVSQLRTVSIVVTCCCPDPAHCHCPDHKTDHTGKPVIRACHKDTHETVAPEAPAFTPTEVAIAAISPQVAPAAIVPLDYPHPSPAPRELSGPS